MLDQSTPMPTIAVKDLAAARQFYEATLGLTVADEAEEAHYVMYKCGQGGLQIYQSDNAGSNKATYATWEVGDIGQAVAALKAKGVSFEHYPDMPGTRLDGDIHAWGDNRAAWFRDPDGNVLCLHQAQAA